MPPPETEFPEAVDTFPSPVSATSLFDNFHKQKHDHATNAMVAVQTTLGVNPHGGYDTVGERIADLAFNVRDHGVVGDGVTDDSAALAPLAVAGRRLYFPPGTYRFNIDLTGIDDLTFVGDGAASRWEPYDVDDYILQITSSNRIRIENLEIDGRLDDDATKAPTYFNTINDFAARNCRFVQAKFRAINFFLTDTTTPPYNGRVRISGCTFEDMELDPIYIGNATEILVHDNYIVDAPDTAIDTGEATERTVIVNNIIKSCQTGIYSAATQGRTLIANNIVDQCSANGISLTTYGTGSGWKGGVVSGNVLVGAAGNGGSAIVCNLEAVSITGNYIKGFGSNQIRVQKPNCHVASNILDTPLVNYCIETTAADISIMSNRFLLGAAGLAGVFVNSVDRAIVKDNAFSGGDPCVQVTSSDNSQVIGNQFYNTRSGIDVADSLDTIVENNRFLSSVFAANELIETGTTDRTILRRNRFTGTTSATIVGAADVIVDNDGYTTDEDTESRLAGLEPYLRTSSYRDIMMALQPAVYWRLDEPSGTTATDETGTSNGAIAAGNITYGLDGPVIGGGAIRLAGGSSPQSHVSIGSSALNTALDSELGTMIAWGRVTDADMWDDASGTAGYLVHLRNGADATHYMVIGHIVSDGVGTVSFRRRAGGAISQVIYDPDGPLNEWFMLVMTWSVAANQMKAYYNGAQVGTTQVAGGVMTQDFTSIGTNVLGAGSSTLQPWIGDMAEVSLFDRVLSAAEIADIYAAAQSPGQVQRALTLTSADGSRFALTVSDAGAVTAVAI